MLTIIKVGNNPASTTYIRNKMKAVEDAGMKSRLIALNESATTEDVILFIETAAAFSTAILVQLPLPAHVEKEAVLRSIPPEKDIDGLNPVSQYDPLTPCAIMRWFREKGIKLQGTSVAVLGRSNLVGKPLTNMLIDAGATVTVMNSHTTRHKRDQVCKQSKIIVSATGNAGVVGWRCVNDHGGQIFVDVGINRDAAGKLCGDVSQEARKWIEDVGSECTPVPGGVGKWTVRELVLRLAAMEGVNKSAE